ncbi:hypothetical protein E3N88_46321 [Mikania micrantha]|uniref:Uncharacterized protein n=1 Tax=Mikania micrantha TaxID=192012 RepID=A0A5N6L6W9_9ASTR|nr:hypothetical protein E3N88_46321 [Mikania micrantha]
MRFSDLLIRTTANRLEKNRKDGMIPANQGWLQNGKASVPRPNRPYAWDLSPFMWPVKINSEGVEEARIQKREEKVQAQWISMGLYPMFLLPCQT